MKLKTLKLEKNKKYFFSILLTKYIYMYITEIVIDLQMAHTIYHNWDTLSPVLRQGNLNVTHNDTSDSYKLESLIHACLINNSDLKWVNNQMLSDN